MTAKIRQIGEDALPPCLDVVICMMSCVSRSVWEGGGFVLLQFMSVFFLGFFSRWGSGAYESGYNNKSAMGSGAGNYADYGYGAEAYGVCLTFSFVSVL